MNLNAYDVAVELEQRLKQNDKILVRVIIGPHVDSIGQILSIKKLYFSEHEYKLSFSGDKRKLIIRGSELELAKLDAKEILMENKRYMPEVKDFLGRELKIGFTVCFSIRKSDHPLRMVLGTIKAIDPKGRISILPVKEGNTIYNYQPKIITINTSENLMIIDKNTVNDVMLLKLAT